MTKKQKQDHIKVLIAIIEKSGYKIDSYGNYKNDTGIYRIKFKKNNLRMERKGCQQWVKIFSTPIVNVQEHGLNNVLNKYSVKLCEIL